MQRREHDIERLLRSVPLRQPSATFGLNEAFYEKANDYPSPPSLLMRFSNMPWQYRTISVIGAFMVSAAVFACAVMIPRPAVAQVIQRIKDSKTIEFDEQVVAVSDGRLISRAHHSYREGGVHRVDFRGKAMDEQSVIIDTSKNQVLVIDGKAKTVRTTPLDNATNADFALKAIEQLRALNAKAGQPVGTKQINGIQVKGYRFRQNGDVRTLWVNEASAVPVQIEMERDTAADRRMRITWSNIKLNSPIPDQVFDPIVPKDYRQLPSFDVDPSDSPGTHFAALMKMYTARNDGEFPADLAEGMRRLAEQIVADNGDENSEATLLAASIRSAAVSAVTRGKRGVRWEYFPGKDLGDTTQPLFWVKLRDRDNRYEIVFADLRVVSVDKSELPKAESR